jgi:glutathione S-transferase
LWFTRQVVPVMAGILDATPAVLAWMDRMAALGHGASEKWTAEQAIALAHSSQPLALPASEVFQDDHGIALGSTVSIAAETFGQEATQGVLLAATRTRYTLRREDLRAGTVHVHFPRIGYVLRAGAA